MKEGGFTFLPHRDLGIDRGDVAVVVTDQEANQIFAIRQIDVFPADRFSGKGDRVTGMRGDAFDLAVLVEVHVAQANGKGVTDPRCDLRRGTGGAAANKAKDLEEAFAFEVQLRSAGFAGVSKGVGAVHSINSLVGISAVADGVEERQSLLFAVGDDESQRFKVEIQAELLALGPDGVVDPGL